MIAVGELLSAQNVEFGHAWTSPLDFVRNCPVFFHGFNNLFENFLGFMHSFEQNSMGNTPSGLSDISHRLAAFFVKDVFVGIIIHHKKHLIGDIFHKC